MRESAAHAIFRGAAAVNCCACTLICLHAVALLRSATNCVLVSSAVLCSVFHSCAQLCCAMYCRVVLQSLCTHAPVLCYVAQLPSAVPISAVLLISAPLFSAVVCTKSTPRPARSAAVAPVALPLPREVALLSYRGPIHCACSIRCFGKFCVSWLMFFFH